MKDHAMLNRFLPIVLTIGIAGSAVAVRAQDALVLKTVTVDIPTSDRMFPSGPGSDAANGYCLVCHSAGMVLTQPHMTQSAWEAEVNKMRTAYKAPIPEEQVQAIASYLAGLQNIK
jgi:hypothetical protein